MIIVVVVVVVVVVAVVVVDPCWLLTIVGCFIFLFMRITTTIHNRVEVRKGHLNCYSLGPQNAEIQPCVVLNTHK